MSKLPVIFFIFLSIQTFAGTVILEKHAVSGYVMPEHSFVKDCKIYAEGFMESVTKSGDGTAIGFSSKIHPVRISTIKFLNHLALNGKIHETEMMCDIGSVVVKGYSGVEDVEFESSLDCGNKRLNQSPAARVILGMAKDLCGF